MAEPTYQQDTWSGLDHYICLVPVGGAPHGWDSVGATGLTRMTQHLSEVHGAAAVPVPPEEP